MPNIMFEVRFVQRRYGMSFSITLWLADEYKEPKPKPTLTEKEMYLCKAYSSGYIARDESRVLHFFTNKPQKGLTGWWATDSIYAIIPPPIYCFHSLNGRTKNHIVLKKC